MTSNKPKIKKTEQINASRGYDEEKSFNSKWNSLNRKSNKEYTKVSDNNETNPYDRDTFYEKLSKQFVEQQEQVKDFRKILLWWFAVITILQLIAINVVIMISIFAQLDPFNSIVDFMKFFVGATFVELLGGLIIIVKFVFNHETSDMLKHLMFIDPLQTKKNPE